MTDIVLYHPIKNQLTYATYAWELIARVRMGWIIMGELK